MKRVADKAEFMKIALAAQINIAEGDADTLLSGVNDILDFCSVIGEFDSEGTADFYWSTLKAPARRADVVEVWEDRDLFMSQSPTREGDFFKVPRIMAEV